VPAGAGLLVRAGKVAAEAATHADEVIDAARALSHTDEAIDALRAADESAQAFVQRMAQEAEERVRREGWAGSLEEARKTALGGGEEVLPGLFKYNPKEPIKGYQQHHLWPIALGGPSKGWVVYARSSHAAHGRIQWRLNQFLQEHLMMKQRDLEAWARLNPEKILPLLREFYQREGIPFPY